MSPRLATVGDTWCTCGCGGIDVLHQLKCLTVAVTQPNAMVNPEGDVFYADDGDDARRLVRHHEAEPLSPDVWPFGSMP
jgi:(2Fe-2S) ferredoxin